MATILLVIDNISKNAFKIMEERKKTEENGIEWRVFERQDILFMECTDNGGGIDLTEILAAAAKQTIEARRNGTIESLNNT